MKHALKLGSLFFLILTYVSCHRHIENTPEIDSEIDLNKIISNIYTATDSIINFIDEYETEDSLTYYSLQNIKSRGYYVKGEFKKADSIADRVISYGKRARKSSSIGLILADAYNNKGIYMGIFNQKDSAIKYFIKAQEILKATGDNKKIIDIGINIADLYHSKGDYTMSSYWYRQTLLLSDSLGVKGFEMPIYSGLAKLYLDLSNFPLSDQYFKLAESYLDNCTNYEKYYFYNSRGNYYYMTTEYYEALEWFYKAYNIIDENVCRLTTSCNLGETYLFLHNADSAEHYITQAKAIVAKMNDVTSEYYIKGLEIYLYLLKNNTEKAKQLIEEVDNTYHNISPEYVYVQNKRLYKYYLAVKDFKNALIHREKMDKYDDSLRNLRIINMIAENDFRYKNDTTIVNQNKKIAISEKKIVTMRYIITIVILVTILLIVLFFYRSILRKKRQEEERQILLATLNKTKAENIKSRISPHYIFNVINAMMPGIRNHKELQDPVRRMVRLLRNGLSASNSNTVSIANEIEYVNDYAVLYKLYSENTPEIIWDIDGAIDLENTFIPTMFIQLPVENAIKYAFAGISEPELKVTIRRNNGTEIIITDNGIGYNNTQQTNSKGTGTGQKVLKEMLTIFNNGKNEKIVYKISNYIGDKGTKVYIFIPEFFNFNIL